MSDENDGNTTPVERPKDPAPATEPAPTPDPDITAPDIEYVINTFDPEEEGPKILNEDKE